MSDWTVERAIEAAKADPESYGRQVYELSQKGIKLSNQLRKLEGWHSIKHDAPKSGRDILLHLPTGESGGKRTFMTIVGHWNNTFEHWEGAGLHGVGPEFWSEIPPAPDHVLVPEARK